MQLTIFSEVSSAKIFHLSESSSSRAEPATQWPVRMPKHLRTLNAGDIAAIVHLFRCLGDAPKVALPAFSALQLFAGSTAATLSHCARNS